MGRRDIVRRLIYLTVAVLVFAIMTLPIFAFVLAARGELLIGNQQSSHVRFFMVNTDEVEGIGVQRTQQADAGPGCLKTSVTYLLWEGQSGGLNTSFCECYNLDTGYVNSTRTCDYQ